LTETKQRKND
jgi:hypothetical protein